MKWMGKDIDKLSDKELSDGDQTLTQMLENYYKKLESNPKKVEKYNISPNPKFEDLHKAMKEEIKKRGLWQ